MIQLEDALKGKTKELFEDAPEPRRTQCRLGYLQSRIEARQRMGREVPESWFARQSELRTALSEIQHVT